MNLAKIKGASFAGKSSRRSSIAGENRSSGCAYRNHAPSSCSASCVECGADASYSAHSTSITSTTRPAHTNTARAILAALIAAMLIFAAFATTGCSNTSTPTNSSTLKVGVRADVTGFGYYNEETQKYYGLEIDIANELAKRLGYSNVEFKTVTPDTRKQTLLDGEVDCIIACYSTSESREANLDFSPAYYTDYSAIMVENSSMITKLSELKNLTIGTMMGTNAAPQLVTKLAKDGLTSGEPVTANKDNSNVYFDTFHLLQYKTYQELSDALEGGKIDAACMDASIAAAYMKDNRSLLDYQVAEQQYGVATQKDSELSAPVASKIQEMLDDSTISSLVDKWD